MRADASGAVCAGGVASAGGACAVATKGANVNAQDKAKDNASVRLPRVQLILMMREAERRADVPGQDCASLT
ncbi:hypothetical protein ABTA92_20145, partial [Acinetobacter baumannii]